jgi:hypothetical protein
MSNMGTRSRRDIRRSTRPYKAPGGKKSGSIISLFKGREF